MELWHSAQHIALQTAYAGVVSKRVDEAPKLFLGLVYAKYFMHRLGHGFGLEVHEDPYLNDGSGVILQTGHTFSDEPDVYIEGKVGVRLEDCFFHCAERQRGVPRIRSGRSYFVALEDQLSLNRIDQML